MREESGQQQHRINPNSHGGQKEHKTDRNEGTGRKRKNEMMGRERRWDGREHSLRRGRGNVCQGKAGQMGRGGESAPIMHFRTGHSDAMPRAGNCLST